MRANEYSRSWFEAFLLDYSVEQTEREIAFLARWLPLPDYARVLDMCCGVGRHSIALAELGYAVTGLDRSAEAIAEARRRGGDKAEFVVGDMRELASVPGTFDAVLNLWQSFGYFDEATNLDMLRQVSGKMRIGGRFVLDINHRGFHEAHQGERRYERDGHVIVGTSRVAGNRQNVTLDYGDGVQDVFDWRLYTPEEICELAASVGLRTLLACAWYDESRLASADEARMQVVFEKV